MESIQKKIEQLPNELQVRLQSFFSLPKDQQLILRNQVLKSIVTPKNALRTMAIVTSYIVSRNYKFTKSSTSLEIASTLLGGHLGYYTIEIIKQLSSNKYIASPLEESLVAALGGLYGSKAVSKVDVTDTDHTIAQTYNLYVYTMYLFPVLLRARYAKQFDKLFPVGVQQ